MKPLFDISKLENLIRTTLYPFQCEFCAKTFYQKGNWIQMKLYYQNTRKEHFKFCSNICAAKFRDNTYLGNCGQCTKQITIKPSEHKKSKSGLSFCSKSCAATYNNTHKTKGTRRSKLEIFIQEKLSIAYSNIEIQYNSKNTIDSELDIYIPSLKLAIELNGILHYKPIFGEEKLIKIKNNDKLKINQCIKNGITLVIIDCSNHARINTKTSEPYFKAVVSIIEAKYKLAPVGVFETPT